MRTSEKVDTILPALMAVKSKLQAVSKSANNPFFKSKYADLNTYLDEVEPHLEANGLVLFQPVSLNSIGMNIVESIIMGKDGQYVVSEMTVVANQTDMQKLGSAITYARRYTLGALLSMKAEDDDGNGASGKEKPTVKPTPVVASKPAAQTVTTTPQTTATVSAAPAKPSFRKPAKPAAEAPKAAPAQEAPVSQGDDI